MTWHSNHGQHPNDFSKRLAHEGTAGLIPLQTKLSSPKVEVLPCFSLLRDLNASQIFMNVFSKFFVKKELLPLGCNGRITAERVNNILKITKEASGRSENWICISVYLILDLPTCLRYRLHILSDGASNMKNDFIVPAVMVFILGENF